MVVVILLSGGRIYENGYAIITLVGGAAPYSPGGIRSLNHNVCFSANLDACMGVMQRLKPASAFDFKFRMCGKAQVGCAHAAEGGSPQRLSSVFVQGSGRSPRAGQRKRGERFGGQWQFAVSSYWVKLSNSKCFEIIIALRENANAIFVGK